MEFTEIQELVYEEYKANGYLEMWEAVDPMIMGSIAEMGLVTTEVSEALESLRDEDFSHVKEECADIIIRVLNFASRHRIELEPIILYKHHKNRIRGKNHGRKV